MHQPFPQPIDNAAAVQRVQIMVCFISTKISWTQNRSSPHGQVPISWMSRNLCEWNALRPSRFLDSTTSASLDEVTDALDQAVFKVRDHFLASGNRAPSRWKAEWTNVFC